MMTVLRQKYRHLLLYKYNQKMKDLLFKNFIEDRGLKVSTAIELGSGEGDDTKFLCEQRAKQVISIDKKKITKKIGNCAKTINDNYFDLDKIKLEMDENSSFDIVFSSCSLCFNTKEQIERFLPFYLEKIKKGGIFYVLDFTSEEKVVTNRTNLWDIWFLTLLNKYFDRFEIRTQNVYEEAHGHSHSIFELICLDKK